MRPDRSPTGGKGKKEPYSNAGYSSHLNQKYATDTNEKSTTSSRGGGGVNKLRTSSGMRNKPQGVTQSTSSSSQTRQNPRGSNNFNVRDKTSQSQPPGTHKVVDQKTLPQSKSQTQLTTYRGFIMTVAQ